METFASVENIKIDHILSLLWEMDLDLSLLQTYLYQVESSFNESDPVTPFFTFQQFKALWFVNLSIDCLTSLFLCG